MTHCWAASQQWIVTDDPPVGLIAGNVLRCKPTSKTKPTKLQHHLLVIFKASGEAISAGFGKAGSTAAADHLVQPGNDPQVTENDLYGSVGNLMNNPSPTEGGTSLIIENELYETCSGYSRNRHDH
ncbi:hypothetical protein E2C01_008915 [Portunus trituberculatus]|uniref:Uncharacterized protein n=1 Tax=Portunus trituberculatus TaxID=210409 RepID=A0A5B7D3A0_PORTR|nr:hypothetical protein [Portunus trituberculatus]